MSAVGCCRVDTQAPQLNDRQRRARAIVGVASLAIAVLARRRTDLVGALGVAIVGWFGISHLVAARTRYPGCPELGAIASLLLRRDVPIGCVPWDIVDHRLRLISPVTANATRQAR